jgi:hypothetical protein
VIDIIIGMDIDGVVAKIDLFKLRTIDFCKDENVKKELERWYYSTAEVGINPIDYVMSDDKVILLTSRPERLNKITVQWLQQHCIWYHVLEHVSHEAGANMGDKLQKWFEVQASKKAELINKLGIEVYFEDTPEVVVELRKLCKNCKVIQYGDRLE